MIAFREMPGGVDFHSTTWLSEQSPGEAKTAVALLNLAKMKIGCVWAPLEIPASWAAILPTLLSQYQSPFLLPRRSFSARKVFLGIQRYQAFPLSARRRRSH